MLSLGPQHSFPLADVFRYLHPETTRDVLVQAFLDAPVFKTRWRWNTTVSLAVPRRRGGRKVAPQLQRMLADDLMAAVFPDAAACLENIPGDREIPDHPLVSQTVRDCLEEAMDFDGLRLVLERIHRGELRLVARDTPEPSFFAHEILNAKPYAFLDDAPLEERRSHAVQSRRTTDPASSGDLGALDADAIARVRDEERPDPRDADELHDALLTAGFLTEAELVAVPPESPAAADRRQTGGAHGCRPQRPGIRRPPLAFAAERLPELRAIHPDARVTGSPAPPPSRWRGPGRGRTRSRRCCGAGSRSPVRSPLEPWPDRLAWPPPRPTTRCSYSNHRAWCCAAISARACAMLEWCDRTLLARIHRYTLHRLRAEIEPVSPADFMRFLFHWQHVEPSSKLTGLDGLREIVAMLDGFEVNAGAWERAVLPSRLDRYEPSMLDMLCLSGEVGWGRLSAVPSAGVLARCARAGDTHGAVPPRARGSVAGAADDGRGAAAADGQCARPSSSMLHSRGASFFGGSCIPMQPRRRPASSCDRHPGRVRAGDIGRILRAACARVDGWRRARHEPIGGASFAGRWTAVEIDDARRRRSREAAVETQAQVLLRRYGIVCRRLLTRETNVATLA